MAALARVVPSTSNRSRVEAAARQLGLTVTGDSLWSIHLSGPASAILKSFGSSRGNDPHSRFGHNLPRVPASFGGMVLAAFGGDENRPAADDFVGGTKGTGGLVGADLRRQYGVSFSSHSGSQTIATVQLSDWNPADLTTYQTDEGLPAVQAGQYQAVKDPSDPPTIDPAKSVEVDLDQEAIFGAAPQAFQRAYMSGNDGGGFFDDIVNIGNDASNPAVDYHITTASISWGLCESSNAADAPFYDAMESALQYVLATGVTVFASTGDSGAECTANTPSVSYPATSPEVVAVGGTQFDNAAPASLPTGESAWNDGQGAGGAGGASVLFYQPSWQVNDGLTGQTMRTVPDISSLAGAPGFEIFSTNADLEQRCKGPCWAAGGGTSLASPTSAALFTDVLAEHGYSWGIGDIHSLLYAKATYAPAASPTFTDITTGTIANGTTAASTGYDLVTGLGTPNWDNLVPHLGGDPHLSIPSYYIPALSTPVTVQTADFQSFTGYRIATDQPAQCAAYDLSASKPTSADFSNEMPPGAPANYLDGQHYVELLAVDSSQACHYADHAVFIDTQRPATRPSLALTSATSGSTITAQWTFTDPAPSSGFNHFAIRITNQAGTPVINPVTTAATHVTLNAVQGWTYTLTVTAYDNAGNASFPAAVKYTVPVDDTHFGFTSGWARAGSSADYGGSDAYSTHAGSYAVYNATAHTYVLWVLTSASGGWAYVYINGTLVKAIDLYASTTHFRVPVTVYSGATAVSRQVKVVVTGVKDGVSHGAYVYLDALQPII
jgi:kumamolisin